MWKSAGGRQAADIHTWLLKKTGPPAKELKTVEDAEAFIDANNVAVVGFFKDQSSDRAKAFLAAAASLEIPFGISSADEVYTKYEAKCGSIVLFKKVIGGYLFTISENFI